MSNSLTLPSVLVLAAVLGLLVLLKPFVVLALLGGAAVALAGIRYPTLLVGLMFLGMFFDRAGLTGFKMDEFPITASKLAVLGSLGLWAAHVTYYRATPFRGHPILTTMVGVVLTTGVCTVVAGSMSVGKFTLFGLAMMTVLVGLVYVILYQAELSGLYRFMSLVFLAVLALSLLQSGSGESGRASGTMGDPNEWATIVLLMSAFLLGGLSDDRHILAPALRVGLLILVPLGILKSESRSALLVGLLLAPVCLYLVRQHKTELIGCAFAAMLGAPLFINQSSLERFGRLVDRFSGEPTLVDDSSLDERAELLAQGLDLFREHWLMGAGPGNFSRATGFISDDGRLRPAHNTWLEIASEQGIVGLIPVGIFLITVSRTFYKGFYTAGSETNRNRVLGAAAGLGAVALMAATLGLVTFAIAYLMLGIGMAVVAQSRNHYAA